MVRSSIVDPVSIDAFSEVIPPISNAEEGPVDASRISSRLPKRAK